MYATCLVPDLTAGTVVIGDHDGRMLITGSVESSNTVAGCHLVETEHGTLYLPSDEIVRIEHDSEV